jgi:transcriptional regulator with XRE-family HTH domain
MKRVSGDQRRQFPRVLRSLRTVRGVLQKTVAGVLDLDAPTLCAVERGVRAPLTDERIQRLVPVLRMSAAELDHLLWAARHDRLLAHLETGGATGEELDLMSKALTTWNFMDSRQRQAWLTQVGRMADSASFLHSAVTPDLQREAAMT